VRGLGVVLAGFLSTLVTGATLADGPSPREFVFSRWNGTYPDLVGELAPLHHGPVALFLESPSNVVRLRDHRLLLTPVGDGTHRAVLEAELQAGGELIGELRVGTLSRPVTDRVVVPPQRFSIPGRIRLVPTLDGFAVTPLELPTSLTVRVQSQLTQELLGLCEQLSIWLLATDCSSLAAAGDRLTVDLPAVGETYVVPSELVTVEERRALLRYLEASEELGR
jgi:hypothetical protein